MNSFDAPSLLTFVDMVKDWNAREIFVCFVKVRSSIQERFRKAGIVGILGEERTFFLSVSEAIQFYVGTRLPTANKIEWNESMEMDYDVETGSRTQ